jgi:hypothetical protein
MRKTIMTLLLAAMSAVAMAKCVKTLAFSD